MVLIIIWLLSEFYVEASSGSFLVSRSYLHYLILLKVANHNLLNLTTDVVASVVVTATEATAAATPCNYKIPKMWKFLLLPTHTQILPLRLIIKELSPEIELIRPEKMFSGEREKRITRIIKKIISKLPSVSEQATVHNFSKKMHRHNFKRFMLVSVAQIVQTLIE